MKEKHREVKHRNILEFTRERGFKQKVDEEFEEARIYALEVLSEVDDIVTSIRNYIETRRNKHFFRDFRSMFSVSMLSEQFLHEVSILKRFLNKEIDCITEKIENRSVLTNPYYPHEPDSTVEYYRFDLCNTTPFFLLLEGGLSNLLLREMDVIKRNMKLFMTDIHFCCRDEVSEVSEFGEKLQKIAEEFINLGIFINAASQIVRAALIHHFPVSSREITPRTVLDANSLSYYFYELPVFDKSVNIFSLVSKGSDIKKEKLFLLYYLSLTAVLYCYRYLADIFEKIKEWCNKYEEYIASLSTKSSGNKVDQ